MKKLKEEMNEMLDIFDAYQIPEDVQKYVITEGIYFCFSYGIDRSGIDRDFDCFKFARFLKFCKDNGVNLDANKIIKDSCNPKYQELVHLFDKLDKDLQSKKKKKTK